MTQAKSMYNKIKVKVAEMLSRWFELELLINYLKGDLLQGLSGIEDFKVFCRP